MATNDRFHNFFPVYGPIFAGLRDTQCAGLFERLETDGEVWNGVCPEVLDCILSGTSESVKGNMASGSVVLGLSPSILSYLGSHATEVALLSRRRPLLAMILAAGSPAVQVLPTYSHTDPVGQLAPRPSVFRPRWLLGPAAAAAVSLLQYAAALAATANTVTVAYYTGLWGINTISCETVYLPLLWVALSGAIHVGAMLALHLQLETTGRGGSRGGGGSLRERAARAARHELTLCATHGEKLEVELAEESFAYIAVSWFTAFLSVVHLLYGTIAFSSVALIGYVDSIKLIGRLMASSIVCRAIVMFELAGMRNARPKGGDNHGSGDGSGGGGGGGGGADGGDGSELSLLRANSTFSQQLSHTNPDESHLNSFESRMMAMGGARRNVAGK